MATQRLLTSNTERPGPPEPAPPPLPLGFCSGPFSGAPGLVRPDKTNSNVRGEWPFPQHSEEEWKQLLPIIPTGTNPDVCLNYLRNCLHARARIGVLWTLGFQKVTNKATLTEAHAEREARLCEPKDTEGEPKAW